MNMICLSSDEKWFHQHLSPSPHTNDTLRLTIYHKGMNMFVPKFPDFSKTMRRANIYVVVNICVVEYLMNSLQLFKSPKRIIFTKVPISVYPG